MEYYDPYVPVIKPTREHPQFAGRKSVEWNRSTIENFDVILIATNHSSVNYHELGAWARCIVDTWKCDGQCACCARKSVESVGAQAPCIETRSQADWKS